MGAIRDTLFGDQGKAAAKQQSKQNAQEREFIMQQTQKAQDLLQSMYPTMQQNTMLGGQAALTTMRNAMPQATYQRQQGTQNAIAALLGGQGAQIQSNQNYIPQNLPNYQLLSQQVPQQTVNQSAKTGANNAMMQQILARLRG